jgi:hypothetical protein
MLGTVEQAVQWSRSSLNGASGRPDGDRRDIDLVMPVRAWRDRGPRQIDDDRAA